MIYTNSTQINSKENEKSTIPAHDIGHAEKSETEANVSQVVSPYIKISSGRFINKHFSELYPTITKPVYPQEECK